MPDYPYKLRIIRRRDSLWLEELAPSRSGSFFIKARVRLPQADVLSAARAAGATAGFGLDVDRQPRPVSNTTDLPEIGG